jgi:hypothetical protein
VCAAIANGEEHAQIAAAPHRIEDVVLTVDRDVGPLFTAPPLSCDTHFHVFGPADRYPHSGVNERLRYAPPAPPHRRTPDDATKRRILVENPVRLFGVLNAGGRVERLVVRTFASARDLPVAERGGAKKPRA